MAKHTIYTPSVGYLLFTCPDSKFAISHIMVRLASSLSHCIKFDVSKEPASNTAKTGALVKMEQSMDIAECGSNRNRRPKA